MGIGRAPGGRKDGIMNEIVTTEGEGSSVPQLHARRCGERVPARLACSGCRPWFLTAAGERRYSGGESSSQSVVLGWENEGPLSLYRRYRQAFAIKAAFQCSPQSRSVSLSD